MPLQKESGTEDIGSNTGEMCREAQGERVEAASQQAEGATRTYRNRRTDDHEREISKKKNEADRNLMSSVCANTVDQLWRGRKEGTKSHWSLGKYELQE